MIRSHCLRASVVLAVVLLGTMSTAGRVVVPIKMRTRVEAPAGTKHVISKNDFIPGKTPREDVEGRYGAAAVETDAAGLFWGRFRASSWAFAAFTALPAPYATGGRLWGVRNLIVTFDENGLVRDSFVVSEGDLHRRLRRALVEVSAHPRESAQPLSIHGRDPNPEESGRSVDLELTSAGAVVTRHPRVGRDGRPRSETAVVTVALADIESLTVGHGGSDPYAVEVVLKFRSKTSVGDHLKFPVDPRDALTIARWWAHVRPELVAGVPVKKSGA
jgi:hypothetical protein